MQLASLFTSIQQVETRRKKEQETTKDHNRHKALANLTKIRYLKQMEKMTKQFKADTPLTNYPMPKSKNSTVLTNNIPHKNDQILIPNIENNITDELNKLGISNSLTPTDNTNTNAEVQQVKVTQDNRLRRTVHEKTSAHNGMKPKKITESMVTINQKELTPDRESLNVKVQQKKITEQNKPTVTTNEKELTPDGASQKVKVQQKKISEQNKPTVNMNEKELTPDGASQKVKVQQKKISEQNKPTVNMNEKELTPDGASQKVKVQQKKISEQNKPTVTTNEKELTPDGASQKVKVQQKKITNQKYLTPDGASQNDPPALEFHQQKITQQKNSTPHEEDETMDIEDTSVMTHIYAKSPNNTIRQENKTSTPHEEDKAMDIEDTPAMTHVYAKTRQNKRREENKASTATNQETDDGLLTNGKLTYQEHKIAYPWAHAASNNTFIKTNLVDDIEYINHKNIEKFLTTNMKKLLTKTIKLPSEVNQKIEKKIKYISDEEYRCRICLTNFKKIYNAIRHVRIELGYKENRCSFCNFMANSTSPIYKHYATHHGIPKEWILSQELTDFVVDNRNNVFSNNTDSDSD